MNSLLSVKNYITTFISRYEAYLKPVGKLFLSLVVFITINSKLGYMQKLNSAAVVMIASLMCSFLPLNFIAIIAAVFVVLHMYALSLECAAIVLVLLLVLLLLYFRLSPKDTMAVVLTPICSAMGIPYIMPVAMGLVGGPYSVASVGCGIIISCVLKTINGKAEELSAMATEDMAARIRFVIDSILDNKSIILLFVAFAITILVVYFVRRLSIAYSWPIAIVAGSLLDAIIVLIGKASLDADLSVAGILLGTILAVAVGLIIDFFMFNVDYSGTEKVQFQDDEYYYYVKAVPKRAVTSARGRRRKGSAPRRRVTPSYTDEDE